jgi:hypothetical protein
MRMRRPPFGSRLARGARPLASHLFPRRAGNLEVVANLGHSEPLGAVECRCHAAGRGHCRRRHTAHDSPSVGTRWVQRLKRSMFRLVSSGPLAP